MISPRRDRLKWQPMRDAKATFHPTKRTESEYAKALKKVARHSARIIEMHVDGDKVRNESQMMKLLAEYAQVLTPWATATADKMIAATSKSNYRAFIAQSERMALALKSETSKSAVFKAALELQQRQVGLIKSIPIEAGERAQKIAYNAAVGGIRADDASRELMRTEEVTESRAVLIARTETARANSVLTQARAESVGSVSYIWRTAEDGDVRPSHADMDGQSVDWDSPPTLDDMTGHAGEYPNCRCVALPVLPERDY